MPDSALQIAPAKASLSQQQSRPVDLFRPNTFAEAMEFAKVLSDSGMVPRAYASKPAAIIASWQHGLELGVGLMQALQGISNINGTPAVFGDLGWALVQNHPDFVDSIENISDTQATCTLKRRGRSDKTWTYTIEMAKTAGLLAKDNWKANPKRMLQWRARSWCMRDQFPDALKGMVIYEEAQDYSGSTIDSSEISTQQPATEKKPEPDKKPEFITLEQATLWYRACVDSGHDKEARGAYLKSIGIEDSRAMTVEQYKDAMTFAQTKTPERIKCAELLEALGWTLPEKQKFVADHKANWKEMEPLLSAELDKRNEKF